MLVVVKRTYVDQHVEAAQQADCFTHGPRTVLWLCEVPRAVHALGWQAVHSLAASCLVAPRNAHSSPTGREDLCCGRPNARRSACRSEGCSSPTQVEDLVPTRRQRTGGRADQLSTRVCPPARGTWSVPCLDKTRSVDPLWPSACLSMHRGGHLADAIKQQDLLMVCTSTLTPELGKLRLSGTPPPLGSGFHGSMD